VLAQDPQKFLVYLNYVFNEKNLTSFCRDEWLKLYDVTFVDELIANVLVFLGDCGDLISESSAPSSSPSVSPALGSPAQWSRAHAVRVREGAAAASRLAGAAERRGGGGASC
jgi:hypothetical protein